MARREIDEQLLLDAALDEFTQYSYDEASINRIISKANMTKGSLYYRFKNKYELYLFLLKESSRLKWEFIHANTKIESDNDRDIFELFLLQAEWGVRFAVEYTQYYKLSKMFSKEKKSPLYYRVLKDLDSADDSGLKKLIEISYKSGNFKDLYSLEFVENVIKSLFTSFDDIVFRNEEFELDKAMIFLKEFVHFMKYGLKG